MNSSPERDSSPERNNSPERDKNPIPKFIAAALAGLILLLVLAMAFTRLTDPTRDTVNTAPPESEVRQLRTPEPATSTAPGAPLNGSPPPSPASTTTDDAGQSGTGNLP